MYTSRIVAEIWLRNLLQGVDIRRSMRIRRRWARRLLPSVGVSLQYTGAPPDTACLLVANHRSYLDPILMLCHVDAFPVAKAELANWPLIGKGAQMAGILYLRRENAKSRAGTLQRIQAVLESGIPVIIFPEGTTSALRGTLPFKKGVFQLAAKQQIPIVPVAVDFADIEDFWVGKETFVAHAGRRFQEKKVSVTLHYGPVIQGSDADTLLGEARDWIENRLLKSEISQP